MARIKLTGNTGRVLNHLQKYGAITSMEAFELFGATRLSAIIFKLREYGYSILSEHTEGINRYGNTTYYATYKLKKD